MDITNLNVLHYKNVFYKQYTFPFREMRSIAESFKNEFNTFGLTEQGMFFYGIDNIERLSDTEANVTMTFYQPALENIAPEGCTLEFADLIHWSDMSYRIIKENHDQMAQVAYAELAVKAKNSGKQITSPFFNEFFFIKDENGEKIPCCVVKAQIR